MSEIYRLSFNQKPPHLPQSIVIKFYSDPTKSKEETGYEVINSQLNNLLIGQAGLGPKILLITTDAIVMEYVPSDQLNQEYDADPKIREDIARKLARFHSIKVPISRNDHLDRIEQMFTVWLSEDLVNSVIIKNFNTINFRY